MLEKGEICSGTSSTTAALVLPSPKTPAVYNRLAWAGYERIRGLEQELGRKFELQITGSTMLCRKEEEANSMKKTIPVSYTHLDVYKRPVYGGTWSYVSEVFQEREIRHEVVTDFNNYDFTNITDDVRMIFLETPSNPLLKITDLEKVCRQAREKGILTVVDNTFMTSYLQRPLELGADIVVYSATKYYGGHSDIIAGAVVVDDDSLYNQLKLHQKILGAILSPFDSFLLAKGIKTLPIRMCKFQ